MALPVQRALCGPIGRSRRLTQKETAASFTDNIRDARRHPDLFCRDYAPHTLSATYDQSLKTGGCRMTALPFFHDSH